MADSTTWLDTISASQAQKEVTANALMDAESPSAFFGRRASTCSLLTWGYYGGWVDLEGVLTYLAVGTMLLPASVTPVFTQIHRRASAASVMSTPGCTQAASGVVTSTSHPFKVGDVVYFTGIVGMTQLNGCFATVTAITTNTFTIDVNTSGYTAWSAGGTQNIHKCGEAGTVLQPGWSTTAYKAGCYQGHKLTVSGTAVTAWEDHRRQWAKTVFSNHLVVSAAGTPDIILTAEQVKADSIEFNGALTGSHNMIWPTMMGKWSVYNNTTGTFTLSVMTAGGTAYTIPQGKRVTVYSDGVGFFGPDDQDSTFTAGIAFGGGTTGVTYAANGQVGRYTKRGKRVEFSMNIILTAKGSSTGVVTLTGLPVASDASTNNKIPVVVNVATVTYTGRVVGNIAPNTSVVALFVEATTAALVALTDTGVANASEFNVWGSYESA